MITVACLSSKSSEGMDSNKKSFQRWLARMVAKTQYWVIERITITSTEVSLVFQIT